MKKLVEKFKSLGDSSELLTIKNYESVKSGEIADHIIDTNVNIQEAKEADLETLKNYEDQKLEFLAEKVGADMTTAQKALAELVLSSERNLNGDNTNQSIAQQEAYISVGKGLRLKATDTGFDLYVTGMANDKIIIKEGEYKKVNSRPKTLVKKAIQKDLKMSKFRNFKLANAESLTVTGDTIQMK